MDDLISRQAALRTDCFGDGHEGLRAFHLYEDYRKMRKYLESLPPVQPEIIRCKDCVHSDTLPEGADNDMSLKCLGIRYGGVMPDWYCEHAERRK